MKKILFAASMLLLIISSCGNKDEHKEIVVNVKTDTVKVYGSGKSATFRVE